MKKEASVLLTTIADHLILNAPNMIDPGLLRGKMGVILFFYHYSHYTDKAYYTRYADLLLDDLMTELDVSLAYSFGSGLSGIGWGIEYLIRQGFIDGDPEEILKDLDQEIMQYDPGCIEDLSFEKGLAGIACYVETRLASAVARNIPPPFDALYRNRLLKRVQEEKILNKDFFSYSPAISLTIPSDWLGKLSFTGKKITVYGLGLKNGLAGYGLTYIL